MRTSAGTLIAILWSGLPTGCAPSASSLVTAEKTVYFPPTAFAEDRPGAWQFINDWYSKHLAAMNEPSLYDDANRTAVIYRFTFLPSFAPPLVVRIEHRDTGDFLTFKKLSGMGGYEPGVIAAHFVRPVSREEWEVVDAAVTAAGIPQMPNDVERNCFDGEEWILETRIRGAYSIATRTSPPACSSCDDMSFLRACLAMLRVGGEFELADAFSTPAICR